MRRTLRRAAAWVPAVVLVPLALGVGVRLTQPDDDVAAMRALYPLDAGTTWVYAVQSSGQDSGTRTVQVVGEATLFDASGTVPAYRLQSHYTDFPGQGPRTTGDYVAVHGDTIREYGGISVAHAFQAIDPPATIYRLGMKTGDSLPYRGSFNGQKYSQTTTLVGRQSVTVGGTTFDGCSHFRNDIPVTAADTSVTHEYVDEWTCPGIGPVRLTDRYDPTHYLRTEELTEFHGVSGNWYAEGRTRTIGDLVPPPVTHQDGAAVGFDTGRTYATAGSLRTTLAWADERSVDALFAPVSDGDVMVTGELDGSVAARDVATGAVRWQVKLHGPILVTPAIADGVVLVVDASKRMWALSTADGSALWEHGFDDIVSASPVVESGEVVVATDDAVLTGLDLADGTTTWSTRLGGISTGAPAAADGRVAVGDRSGTLSVYDAATGHAVWDKSLTSAPAEAPVMADGRVLLADDDGVVSSYDAGSGRLQWETHSHGIVASPISVGRDFVAVTVGSTLDVCDLSDGQLRWQHHVSGPTHRSPVSIVGDELVTVSTSGHIIDYAEADGHLVDRWSLPTPVDGVQLTTERAPGLVGGDLVISADVQGSLLVKSVLYAYPVRATATGAGVLLGLDARPVPVTTVEPVTESGGDLLVPGTDRTLRAVDAAGHDTTLLTNRGGAASGAVVAGGLVIARQDDQLTARPLVGGPATWSVPAGGTYYGSVPAVAGGTVYAGTADGRLLALDARTGVARWTAPAGTKTPTTPLVLPGGDIVYGSGLARYDAGTGDRLWTVDDAQTAGSPAYDEGVVLAQLIRQQQPSGLYAFDATTGQQLWSHPDTPAVLAGPAAADGVVVTVDAAGTVTALDVATGKTIWSLAQTGAAGAVPFVNDGRVDLVQLGRYQDLDDRDYRVSVHDLHTGAYLGSWQPPSSVFAVRPVAGPTPDGRLLVPVSVGGPVVVAVSPRG